MRIISPDFHDYYDGVQSLGQDRSLVYVRTPIEVPSAERANYPEPSTPFLSHEELRPSLRRNTVYISPFWLAVAGKIYRGYRIYQAGIYPLTKNRTEHVYDLTTLDSTLSECGIEPLSRPTSYHGHSRWRVRQDRERRRVHTDWLSQQGTHELEERLATRGVVLAAAYLGRQEDHPLMLNPRLADFQFYKIMDAFTVYQEIAMWIGGVLPARGAMTADVSDADRFVEHGFDARTSFRRDKERRS